MSSRPAPTFYILHGDDDYSLRAQVQAMRDQMGDPSMADLNISVMDGQTTAVADVLAAARAMPFLSDKRLIIVEGMLSWLSRKGGGKTARADLDQLVAGLPDLPDWARLVFVERGTISERNAVLKLAKTDPGGFHKTFNPPRNPQTWITRQARSEYEAEIEPQAAQALAAVVGDDLRAADNELAKLALYVNGERPISAVDVALLTAYVQEENIFEMVDALGRRDGPTAIRLMHSLLEDGEPLSLFGMVIRQFRLLIQAREHLNAGGSPKGAGQALGVHPFVGQKAAEQARAFSLEQLEQVYHALLDTDAGIKTGKVDAIVALDMLVAGICT